MNIDEIASILKQVSDEVAKMKSESDKPAADINQEDKLLRLAKEYPITSHVLRDCAENVRYDYIAVLMSLFDIHGNEQLRLQRMLLIYRIIASFDNKINISDYVVRSMKVDIKYWDSFLTTLDSRTAFSFAVDVLLLGMYDVSSTKRKKYEEISDILQFLKLERALINKAAKIAKAIMEQDFDCLLQQIEPSDDMNYSCFLGYFTSIPYNGIANNLESAGKMKGNVLVANAVVSHCKEFINLDNYAANDICFRGCTFEFIRGIRSKNKRVTFEDCSFNGNAFEVTERSGGFGFFRSSYTECEKDYVFIQGNNFKFIKSKFADCKASKSLLNVSDSELTECKFVNCSGQNMNRSYLFDLKATRVYNSKFSNCRIETKTEGAPIGGIAVITNGSVHNCDFNNCTSYGDSSYGSYGHYYMRIICAENSKISKCSFKQCCCRTDDSSNRTVENYIIGLKNSKEENNEFINCESYHYHYSDRGSSHNVGNVKDVR